MDEYDYRDRFIDSVLKIEEKQALIQIIDRSFWYSVAVICIIGLIIY